MRKQSKAGLEHHRKQFEDAVAEVGLGLKGSVLNRHHVEDDARLLFVSNGAEVDLLPLHLNLHLPCVPVNGHSPQLSLRIQVVLLFLVQEAFDDVVPDFSLD